MKELQSTTIGWVLFWTFWFIYVLTAFGTLGMLFFGFGTVQQGERTILVNAFLVETAVAIFGLFYSVFKLRKLSEAKDKQISEQDVETLPASVSNEKTELPFHPHRNMGIIEKAVYELRNITGADLCWTGLRNDNAFLEFCLQDFSETWLVQEIPDPRLSGEIRRQIKIVNRHLNGWENRHQKVIIILFIFQKISYEDRASLQNQLQIFHSTESLSSKISFRVWDAKEVERVLED